MKNIQSSLAPAAVAAALSLGALAPAAFADGSRAPLQDTFVRHDQPSAAFGSDPGIIVGNGREGCMMFDVSGLANITAARIRFRVTQCGATAGVVWPLYFRVMRNDRWNENSLTWNSLPDEFRVGPSPVLATNDVSLAGYIEIPAGSADTWQEVDVTEAVKAAAPQGRLALHVCTSWNGDSEENTPLAFASSDREDASLRPTLEFTGAADASASSLTIVASADTHVQSGNANRNFGSADDAVMVDCNGRREAFIKFDLSNVSAPAV
ncbi:MAG: DNRLRE domain-containing protein, partial [Kiritimatiellae bacterium]|nr:DNRLRE domain-containing protein [Kiritimatiellia bacterium]